MDTRGTALMAITSSLGAMGVLMPWTRRLQCDQEVFYFSCFRDRNAYINILLLTTI